ISTYRYYYCPFFFQAEDGIRDRNVTGVQTCALPISREVAEGVAQEHERGLPGAGVLGALGPLHQSQYGTGLPQRCARPVAEERSGRAAVPAQSGPKGLGGEQVLVAELGERDVPSRLVVVSLVELRPQVPGALRDLGPERTDAQVGAVDRGRGAFGRCVDDGGRELVGHHAARPAHQAQDPAQELRVAAFAGT